MASDWLTTSRFILGAAATIVYVIVGIVVGRRRTSREALLGLRAFQAFWWGLAVLTLLTPLLFFLDSLQIGGLGVRIFILEAALILIVLAIGGLLYYLGYVYSGRKWLIWPIAIYSFVEIAFLVTAIGQAHITGYGDECPGRFCFENDLQGTPMSIILSLSLFVPILLGVVGYFALYFRMADPVPRRRIVMVAASLGLWFGSSLAATFVRGTFETQKGVIETTLNQARVWTDFAAPAIGLAAALIILWAYSMKSDGEPTDAKDGTGRSSGGNDAGASAARRLSTVPALT